MENRTKRVSKSIFQETWIARWICSWLNHKNLWRFRIGLRYFFRLMWINLEISEEVVSSWDFFCVPKFSCWLRWWLNSLKKKKINLQYRRLLFVSRVWKIPWRRKQQLTPVFLPSKSYGQMSLAAVHGVQKSQIGLRD